MIGMLRLREPCPVTRTCHPDLFATESQPSLFGTESAPAYTPHLSKLRARLNQILAKARAAQRQHCDSGRLSLYRTIFPQMTLFLPEDEGAQLRLQFEFEMARLAVK